MASKLCDAVALILGSVFPGYAGPGRSSLAAVDALARFLRPKASANARREWIAFKAGKMRPIVAAFEVVERRDMHALKNWVGVGDSGPFKVGWELDAQNDFRLISVGIYSMGANLDTSLHYNAGTRKYEVYSEGAATGELMARGLYRLGLGEDVLSQLPALSADEKMEIRLSFPREFWPRRWLNKELFRA